MWPGERSASGCYDEWGEAEGVYLPYTPTSPRSVPSPTPSSTSPIALPPTSLAPDLDTPPDWVERLGLQAAWRMSGSIPPHTLPTLLLPMRPEGRQPTLLTASEAPVGEDLGEQAPHPTARAWPSGDSEAPAPDRLSGMVELHSMRTSDGGLLMGAAAVGPDVESLGLRLDGSVRDDYLRYLQRVHHGEALRRLEGSERQMDVHMPVSVGGGLRPPQDRPPPTPGGSAYMGLPLLRQ